jgi:hypothetical protein
MCETAFERPKAPKTKPISLPFPIARKLTAPRDWSAGWPPLVSALREVRNTKSAWEDVGDIAMSTLAEASMKSDMAATRRSNRIAEAWCAGVEFFVGAAPFEEKYARITVKRSK